MVSTFPMHIANHFRMVIAFEKEEKWPTQNMLVVFCFFLRKENAAKILIRLMNKFQKKIKIKVEYFKDGNGLPKSAVGFHRYIEYFG